MGVKGIYQLDDVLDFGKHRGMTVEDAIVEHPGYIDWCLENVDGFELDEEALQFWEHDLKKVRRPR